MLVSRLNFPKGPFSIIYADPPWDYKGQRQHNGKGGRETGGAVVHYPTLIAEDMGSWAEEIQELAAEDCLLFMWSSSPHLDQAIELGRVWGFRWATVGFVWHKQRTNPGFYTMSECELCLIFKRGCIPQPRGARNERQFVSAERGRHSGKPEEVRARITRMFPDLSKIELFARERVEGWQAWGGEVPQQEN